MTNRVAVHKGVMKTQACIHISYICMDYIIIAVNHIHLYIGFSEQTKTTGLAITINYI